MIYMLIALAAFIALVLIFSKPSKQEQPKEPKEDNTYFPVDPRLPIEEGDKKPADLYDEDSFQKTYLVAEKPTLTLSTEATKKAAPKKKATKKATDQKVVKRVETMKLEEKPKTKTKTKGK